MLCLGIEGTAHTIGIGIVDETCNVLANEYKMYQPAEGGIHPREAANHHAKHLPEMIEAALTKANVKVKELDLISFSQGPGLGPCLRTAATAARTLALLLDKPIIGVNHCIAHLEIGTTTGCNDPILLYVSGGNTQVIAFAHNRFRVFGETLDIGLGNMLDKFGRNEGMKFPAGASIEKLAGESISYIPLPYSVKGMDVAFSGILTAAMHERSKCAELGDVCFSLQETCFAMLTEVTERAMAHTEKTEVLLGGGVVRNRRLQEMVRIMAEERSADFFIPAPDLCIDNGAMIAWTGLVMHNAGVKMDISATEINQKFRTDDVEVTWRQD